MSVKVFSLNNRMTNCPRQDTGREIVHSLNFGEEVACMSEKALEVRGRSTAPERGKRGESMTLLEKESVP